MTRTRTLSPALVLLLWLSGCGDDSDTGATDTASGTTATTATTATTEDVEACDASYQTYCVDADVLSYCVDGNVETESCLRLCTEDGLGGVTYPNGHCHDVVPAETACHCCSPDDGTDCPM